jgi:ankyrin repeat protein
LPALQAALAGQTGIIEYMLGSFADTLDLDAQDAEGQTALHHAAAAGHIRVVATLVKACKRRIPDKAQASTPLHLAAARNSQPIVELLLEQEPGCLEDVRADGCSALHLAAAAGAAELVAFLLQQEPKVNMLEH